MQPKTSRRGTFLINKRFQLRFSFYVCSWLILLSFVYPLIISNLLNYFISYLAADPLGPGLAMLEKTRAESFQLLLLMQGVLIGFAFLISIFMSHRIAGPLYKLRNYFIDAKNGNLDKILVFRKNDYFSEMVPAYNEMMAEIQNQLNSQQQVISTATTHLERLQTKLPPQLQIELKETLDVLKTVRKK